MQQTFRHSGLPATRLWQVPSASPFTKTLARLTSSCDSEIIVDQSIFDIVNQCSKGDERFVEKVRLICETLNQTVDICRAAVNVCDGDEFQISSLKQAESNCILLFAVQGEFKSIV
jgi:hypothetical protein